MRNTLNSIDPIPTQLGEKAEEPFQYAIPPGCTPYKVTYDLKPLPAVHVDHLRLGTYGTVPCRVEVQAVRLNESWLQSAWTSGAWMAGPQDETSPCPKCLEPMERPAEVCEGCRQFEAEQKAYVERVTADPQRFGRQWIENHEDGSVEFWWSF